MSSPVLTEEKIFYDFCLRGTPQGTIQGASITFYNVIKRDGEIISANPDQQMPVTLGVEQGAPLEEVVGAINTALLLEREQLLMQIAQLTADAENVIAEKDAAINELQQSLSDAEAALQEAAKSIEVKPVEKN